MTDLTTTTKQLLRQLWIVGPVCVGKSTLAEMIAAKYNCTRISEARGGVYGILERIPLAPSAVVEHCHLLKVLDVSWPWEREEVKALRRLLPRMDLKVIMLTASKQLLLANKQQRLDEGEIGDYIRVDQFDMQEVIEETFLKLQKASALQMVHLHVSNSTAYPECVKMALDFAEGFLGESS